MNNTLASNYPVMIECEGGRSTNNKDLLALSKQIRNYVLSEKIKITEEYLIGHLNVTADWESRSFQDKSDWKILPKIFSKLCQKLRTPSIDLVAS